jgi:hypothetical protein
MKTYTFTKETLNNLIQKNIQSAIKVAYKKGFLDGISHALQIVKPAISDGLRYASPICASMMRLYRK